MSKYIEELNRTGTFSMSVFNDIAWQQLDEKYREKPWLHLSHGTELLTDEQELNAYIAAYGDMHEKKCRAALQNLPFEELLTTFEVVDWGCGQGVASLTFCDMLNERNKLNLLKKVTLIEPSAPALERAVANIRKANPGATVIPVNKYLPGDGSNDEIEGFDHQYTNVIHIFSNILDIPTVNLLKLSNVIADGGVKSFIVCMGPLNSGSYRIDQFCSIFGVKSFFSDITSYECGFTSRTNHRFSCKAKGLIYSGEGLTTSRISEFKPADMVDGKPVLNDYDPRMMVQNKILSESVFNIYKDLSSQLGGKDLIFVKPDINGDSPDMVVVRPNKGVFIVTVCEDDIKTIQSKIEYKKDYNREKVRHPLIYSIKKYKENLIKLHIKDLYGKTLVSSDLWSIVHCMIIFTKCEQSDINATFKDIEHKYIYLLSEKEYIYLLSGKEKTESGKEKTSKCFFDEFNNNNNFFDSIIKSSFIKVLSPDWHPYKLGKHIVMNSQQRILAMSKASRSKISGVAGSGKTQVLAFRVVNAQLRTGGKILVLTFNITLVNYIRYRMNQIRADFSWSNFLIINYHQLIKSTANNLGINALSIGNFDDPKLFADYKDKISRFSAIFIDEVQDYKSEWLKILDTYFIESDSEFVVFGDAKQNIYNRELDNNGQVRIGFIPGQWNNSLSKGYRFNNVLLARLATKFQQKFYKTTEAELSPGETASVFNTIKYYLIDENTEAGTLVRNCLWFKDTFKLDFKNTVILSETCDIIRDMDYFYRNTYKCLTQTTVESTEEYNALPRDKYFQQNIEELRRNKKLHFTMEAQCLKMSTVQSFKGWEADNVILIIQPEKDSVATPDNKEQDTKKPPYTVEKNTPEEMDALIYTAITRARENLYILNMGNLRYDDFFKKEAGQDCKTSDSV